MNSEGTKILLQEANYIKLFNILSKKAVADLPVFIDIDDEDIRSL